MEEIEWMSPETYIKNKLKSQGLLDFTDSQILEYRKKGKVPEGANVGHIWWASVTLRNPPQCSTCLEDTERYKKYKLTGDPSYCKRKSRGLDKKEEFEYDCCKFCLWWDWFEKKRAGIKKYKK